MYNNEKWQNLDKYKNKSKDDKYVFFLFVTLFSLQKKSNRLLDLDR